MKERRQQVEGKIKDFKATLTWIQLLTLSLVVTVVFCIVTALASQLRFTFHKPGIIVKTLCGSDEVQKLR